MGIGFDFGTTNSSLAITTPNGDVRLARFPFSGGVTESFRSLLYLEKVREKGRSHVEIVEWPGGYRSLSAVGR